MRNPVAAKRQGSKYKKLTTLVKKLIKQRRVELKATRPEFTVEGTAKKLKISRKKLEDFETLRNFGCYFDVEDIANFARVLEVEVGYLFDEGNLA